MNNPIKILILVLSLFLFGNVRTKAQDIQYATIVQTESFTLSSNQTAMVISCACSSQLIGLNFTKANGNSASTYISPTDSTYAGAVNQGFLYARPSIQTPLVFAGPGYLYLAPVTPAVGLPGSTQGSIGIKVTTTTIASPGTVLGSGLPSTAVVIPSQTTGPVNIILESSTDLVNWTATSPGTFGGNNSTNRFFRVRAQAQ